MKTSPTEPDLTGWPPARNRAFAEELRQKRAAHKREADVMTTDRIRGIIANAAGVVESVATRIKSYCDEYELQGGAGKDVARCAKMALQLLGTAEKMAEIAGVKTHGDEDKANRGGGER